MQTDDPTPDSPGRKWRLLAVAAAVLVVWVGVAWYREELGQRLIDAAWAGDVRAGRSLLDRGANPNANRTRKERFIGLPKVLLDLLTPGDKQRGYTPLMIATMHGDDDPQLTALLIDRGAAVNQRGWLGLSPLQNAVRARNPRTCELLLSRGARVNQPGGLEEPPLVGACWGGGVSSGSKRPLLPIVRLLCEAGAELDAADRQGRTALMGAALEGDIPTLRYLIQRGAAPGLADDSKRTALDYARLYRKPEAERLLRETKRRIEAARVPVR
jgi:ankyrin repeat protein